jgi:hypothetical protein
MSILWLIITLSLVLTAKSVWQYSPNPLKKWTSITVILPLLYTRHTSGCLCVGYELPGLRPRPDGASASAVQDTSALSCNSNYLGYMRCNIFTDHQALCAILHKKENYSDDIIYT